MVKTRASVCRIASSRRQTASQTEIRCRPGSRQPRGPGPGRPRRSSGGRHRRRRLRRRRQPGPNDAAASPPRTSGEEPGQHAVATPAGATARCRSSRAGRGREEAYQVEQSRAVTSGAPKAQSWLPIEHVATSVHVMALARSKVRAGIVTLRSKVAELLHDRRHNRLRSIPAKERPRFAHWGSRGQTLNSQLSKKFKFSEPQCSDLRPHIPRVA